MYWEVLHLRWYAWPKRDTRALAQMEANSPQRQKAGFCGRVRATQEARNTTLQNLLFCLRTSSEQLEKLLKIKRERNEKFK